MEVYAKLKAYNRLTLKNDMIKAALTVFAFSVAFASCNTTHKKCYVSIQGDVSDDLDHCLFMNEHARTMADINLEYARIKLYNGERGYYLKRQRELDVELVFDKYDMLWKVAEKANMDTIPYQFKPDSLLMLILDTATPLAMRLGSK